MIKEESNVKQLIQVRLDSEKIKDNKIMQYIAANKDIPKATLIRNALYQAALAADPELNIDPEMVGPTYSSKPKKAHKDSSKDNRNILSPKEGYTPL